jgi:hypothetical protein
MTNLMQQLQAWADRGAFKFPEGDDKGGFTMIKEDSNNPNIGAWELTPEQNFGIKCVLDGTIQVWRPVEHYPPPENAEVLALFLVSENAGYEHGIVETNVEKGFTHWQPLPNSELVARLKGGE